MAEAARRRLPTPEARHRRQAHPDVSVTGATECCDRFNGSAPTIDWWHSVSSNGPLAPVIEGERCFSQREEMARVRVEKLALNLLSNLRRKSVTVGGE